VTVAESSVEETAPVLPSVEASALAGYPAISEKYGFGEWVLAGHGVAYFDCGALRFRGCLRSELHHGSLEDPFREGKVFVQGYYRSCNRKECPVCYESWAGLESARAVHRLLSYCVSKKTVDEIYSIKDPELRSEYVERAFKHARRKPIHVIFSVPEVLWSEKIEVLRVHLYKIAKKCGLSGGCAIFHPFREHHVQKTWYWSPHFHVIAFGWVKDVRSLHSRYGWIIKNVGVRASVHATLLYQLSHAGVHKDHHVVTWFGACSYNKLRVAPLPEFKPVCPVCGSDLEDLLWCGGLDRPPPDIEGNFWCHASDWRVKVGV